MNTFIVVITIVMLEGMGQVTYHMEHPFESHEECMAQIEPIVDGLRGLEGTLPAGDVSVECWEVDQ